VARVPDATLDDSIPVHNNLVRATYNNPEMHRGFASLSGRVHSASHLPDRVRELAVLRIAALLGAEFEWNSHAPRARDIGISELELQALRRGEIDAFEPSEAAVIRFAVAVEERTVDDVLWREVAAYYDATALLDLTMLVAFYGLASRLVLALDINDDSETA